ncbi:carbohydrate esterase family 16 protein [Mycena olivaceomarginata]|nr:carbohydrate esterase family 16 protein [Mycena olivaceomarginata]
MVSRTWTSIVTLVSIAAARQTNDGVHLAITPVCGKLGGTFANANAGVPTTGIKMLVAFGDSYTSGGRSNSGTLPPAVLNGTSPCAGGRGTDGPVWAEDVASDPRIEITLFQVSGTVVNVTLWPSEAGQTDFLHEGQCYISATPRSSADKDFTAALFLSQKNVLDPATTLYTVFFGINDFGASSTDGNHLSQAAAELLTQIKQLAATPTLVKNIVVLDNYGRGGHSATGDTWKQAVFAGLTPLCAQGLNVAFVDFVPLWDAVLGTTPGFTVFGYKTSGACIPNLSQTDLSGECATPLNLFYWLPGHPSKETHRIMADYVKLVLTNCEA